MIPYGRQQISSDDVAAVVEVLQSDFLTTGPEVEKFELRLQEQIDGVGVVAVSSGTAALHTAYVAAGLGPGDEIITPPITFVATQAMAAALGVKIVFADVCEDTANIDPCAVEAAITPRTRAVVAVDYAGHPAALDELRAVADKYSILLIEDAAHSLGSRFMGRAVGSIADLTAFSFFPTKNITTAEGGAVAAKDSSLLAEARTFSRQGLIRDPKHQRLNNEGPWHQEVQAFGFNYRLPDVLAALGTSQLGQIEKFKEKRASIKEQYDGLLSEVHNISVPTQRNGVEPMWHLYPLQVEPCKRRKVFEYLRGVGIGVQVNYLPAYWHPVFSAKEYPRGLCPVAEEFYSREISLPMHVDLPVSDLELITIRVKEALSQ